MVTLTLIIDAVPCEHTERGGSGDVLHEGEGGGEGGRSLRGTAIASALCHLEGYWITHA